MSPRLNESWFSGRARFLFARRAEIALGFFAAAFAAMAAIWAFSFSQGPRAGSADGAPSAFIRLEALEQIKKSEAERRQELEKVFQRRYPNPFVPWTGSEVKTQ